MREARFAESNSDRRYRAEAGIKTFLLIRCKPTSVLAFPFTYPILVKESLFPKGNGKIEQPPY